LISRRAAHVLEGWTIRKAFLRGKLKRLEVHCAIMSYDVRGLEHLSKYVSPGGHTGQHLTVFGLSW
jgi:hypothetical protein